MPIVIEVILCLHILETKYSTLTSPYYLVPYHHLIQFLLQKHHSLQQRADLARKLAVIFN